MSLSNTSLLVKYHEHLFNKLINRNTKSDDSKSTTKNKTCDRSNVDLNNYVRLMDSIGNFSEFKCGIEIKGGNGKGNGNGEEMYLIDDNGLLYKRHDYTLVGYKQGNDVIVF